jgi:hypothetical protein
MRTADGRRIPLVLLMFLESPTHEYLSGLAKEKNARFRARGHSPAHPDGPMAFEPSRCIFVHRLP